MKPTPDIELLWWEGCPSTGKARSELRTVLDGLGLEGVEISSREIVTDAEAETAEFRGSPTILVDGKDVAGDGDEQPVSLSCRVYRRRDGRISPTPDPEDVRDAVRRALTRLEVTR